MQAACRRPGRRAAFQVPRSFRPVRMARSGRLFLLLLPLVPTVLLQALPGRAQPPTSARFAFADTTLLRDTLDLHFNGIFEAADSLKMDPATLRTLMIRYKLPLLRMLFLADSLGMPVDSVGPEFEREQLNPLNVGARRHQTAFQYTSSYGVQQTSTDWTNGGAWHLVRGPFVASNNTGIEIQRNTSTGGSETRTTRTANSLASWRLTNGISLGGRANLSRYSDVFTGGSGDVVDDINDLGLALQTRQSLGHGLSTELNVTSGYRGQNGTVQNKHGVSGDVNGRVRFQGGPAISNDLQVDVNGDVGRSRRSESTILLLATDAATNARGTFTLFANAPVGFALNYGMRRSLVETPVQDRDSVARLITSGANADGTLRLRKDNDRYLNLTGSASTNHILIGSASSLSTRADGRYVLGKWVLEGNYADALTQTRYPFRNGSYGYNENHEGRSAGGRLTRQFGSRIVEVVTLNISLDQYRYVLTQPGATLPLVPRDAYSQSYRFDTRYTASENVSSTLGFEADLTRAINLPAQSTGANVDTRSYRADWSWTYRLLRGLTANQTNRVEADYQFFVFSPTQNDLSFNYTTTTSLAATVTPHLSIALTHTAVVQPRGNYLVLSDGREYFLAADNSVDYKLGGSVSYTLSRFLTVTVQPSYDSNRRDQTVNGAEAPNTLTSQLILNGTAIMDFPLGPKGHLTGTIARTLNDTGNIQYQSGLRTPQRTSQQQYWNGSLQLSWNL